MVALKPRGELVDSDVATIPDIPLPVQPIEINNLFFQRFAFIFGEVLCQAVIKNDGVEPRRVEEGSIIQVTAVVLVIVDVESSRIAT